MSCWTQNFRSEMVLELQTTQLGGARCIQHARGISKMADLDKLVRFISLRLAAWHIKCFQIYHNKRLAYRSWGRRRNLQKRDYGGTQMNWLGFTLSGVVFEMTHTHLHQKKHTMDWKFALQRLLGLYLCNNESAAFIHQLLTRVLCLLQDVSAVLDKRFILYTEQSWMTIIMCEYRYSVCILFYYFCFGTFFLFLYFFCHSQQQWSNGEMREMGTQLDKCAAYKLFRLQEITAPAQTRYNMLIMSINKTLLGLDMLDGSSETQPFNRSRGQDTAKVLKSSDWKTQKQLRNVTEAGWTADTKAREDTGVTREGGQVIRGGAGSEVSEMLQRKTGSTRQETWRQQSREFN